MQVTKLDESFPFTPSDGRTGTHVSAVIKYIEAKLGKDRGDLDDTARLRMEMGFVWEAALESAYKDRLGIRPSVIELDGILGSPDGIESDGAIGEYKLTWSSSRTAIETRWRWLVQVMAYCRMCGTDAVVFRVFYVNGDYKTKEPQYQVTRIQFSQQEIDTNWQMITSHARQMEREANSQ